MKRIFAMLLVVAAVLGLAACKEPQEEAGLPSVVTGSPAPSASPTATPKATEEPSASPAADGFVNPLTGEPVDEDLSTKRPVAIMVNNYESSQPLHGILDADILYEMPSEGWTTRWICLYQDYEDLGVVGSVRSARPCYVEMADAHDAIYFHAGGSDDGVNAIYSYGIDNVDATAYDGVYFYRDAWRRDNIGYEHSMMTKGEMIQKAIENLEFDTEHDSDYENTMLFAEDGTPANGEDGSTLTVWYSEDFKYSHFTYDEAAGGYSMYQWGYDLYDANGDAEDLVYFENVVVIVTTIYAYDDAAHQYVDFESGGEGYYFSGGKYIPIQWSREEGEQIEYTDMDGNPLTFGVGSTFVCVTSDETSIIEIGEDKP